MIKNEIKSTWRSDITSGVLLSHRNSLDVLEALSVVVMKQVLRIPQCHNREAFQKVYERIVCGAKQ